MQQHRIKSNGKSIFLCEIVRVYSNYVIYNGIGVYIFEVWGS